jgi:hypothetical protein
MARKVIERTVRTRDGLNERPDYWTQLSFIGGIDLGQITDEFFNSDHIFLRKETREFRVIIYTCYSLDMYHTTLNALRGEGTQRAIRAGTNNEIGYLVSGYTPSEALRTHKRVVNRLKEAYFRSNKKVSSPSNS